MPPTTILSQERLPTPTYRPFTQGHSTVIFLNVGVARVDVPVLVGLRCKALRAEGALEGTGVGFGVFTIRRGLVEVQEGEESVAYL